MMNREEIKDYAMKICVPLMERTIRRAKAGIHAFQPDQVGYIPADLENFCRPFWGIAPLVAQGEEITLHIQESTIPVAEYVRSFLTEGLSVGGKCSWDQSRPFLNYNKSYTYENQNITELAGLLIGIFFARDQLWEPIPEAEKRLIADGIHNMAEAAFDHSWPNNHYWFPLFAFTVLKRLGYIYDRTEEMIETGLDFLDTLYIGNGWYQDGAFGRFDYYEAWSLHLYPLLWTLIADESFEGYQQRKENYIERTNLFLDFYAHWFDEKGANVPFGRSLSYRFAACALFPVAVLAGCRIDPALAGRITVMNIEFFKENVRTEETDILPEGYLYHSPNVIEGYTSDGGAYWCCKAFLALLIPREHSFWNTEQAKLPIEQGDYLAVPKHGNIHMLFEGHDGIVNFYNNTAQYYLDHRMTHFFGDVRSWYAKFVYNSAGGFGCAAPDRPAIDSMISLMTPDQSMQSHRLGFTDLGWEDGVLHSIHTPFFNDRGTVIETFLIPLGGVHVRIHRVKLSGTYYVQEGGFSLGRWDDYCPREISEGYAGVANQAYFSCLRTVAEEGVEINCGIGSVQAGCHMYAPLADYPMYVTKQPLEAGEYLFAAAFLLCKLPMSATGVCLPDICIKGKRVTVRMNGRLVFDKDLTAEEKKTGEDI